VAPHKSAAALYPRLCEFLVGFRPTVLNNTTLVASGGLICRPIVGPSFLFCFLVFRLSCHFIFFLLLYFASIANHFETTSLLQPIARAADRPSGQRSDNSGWFFMNRLNQKRPAIIVFSDPMPPQLFFTEN